MNKLLKSLGALATVSALIAAGFLVFDFLQTREKFPTQTFVGDINFSGLNQTEALKRLRLYRASDLFSPLVTFEAENLRISFPPAAVGISIDYEQTVKNAFKLTHENGYLGGLRERLEQKITRCPLILRFDKDQASEVIAGLAAEIRSTPRDASVIYYAETGGYHIEPEILGKTVREKETFDAFKARLSQGEKVFPLILDLESPRITERELRASPPVYRLAAYTTYYGRHDSPNRIHNIKLVASWINNKLLMPGDQFSVAEVLGEVTPEQGFKEAFVIVKGELVPLLGGGSCQIATTLYNTVQLADLKVVQRKSHSMYFNIYPLGRDAGVYPGQLDFKFENDSGHPILIKTVATNRRLTFRIYGTPSGKKVKFSSPTVWMRTEEGYVPATVTEVLEADAPFKTSVTRTVFDAEGNKIKEETILSFYKLYGEKENVPIARPEPR